MATTNKPFEVHTHCIVSGPRANKTWLNRVTHAHEGGNEPHQHPQTGPASYTIDKDDWYRATGLRGGGCKKFTAKPNGEQLPILELEDSQRTFEVIVDPSSKRFAEENNVTGPGGAIVARMVLGFGMEVTVIRDFGDGEAA